jgi:hypothetical protein
MAPTAADSARAASHQCRRVRRADRPALFISALPASAAGRLLAQLVRRAHFRRTWCWSGCAGLGCRGSWQPEQEAGSACADSAQVRVPWWAAVMLGRWPGRGRCHLGRCRAGRRVGPGSRVIGPRCVRGRRRDAGPDVGDLSTSAVSRWLLMRTVMCPPDGVACRALSSTWRRRAGPPRSILWAGASRVAVTAGGEFVRPVDHGGPQDEVDGFGGQPDALFYPGEGEQVVDKRPARCASRRICRVRFSRCAGLGLARSRVARPAEAAPPRERPGKRKSAPIAGDLRLAAEAGQGGAGLACRAWML